MIDPPTARSIEEKAQNFVSDTKASELKLFIVANWTLSLVFNGLATGVYGLIAGCFVYALGKCLVRKMGFGKARR